MAKVDNRVLELSDGDGAGSLRLNGAQKHNNSFDIFNQEKFYYVVDLAEGEEWEAGIGHVNTSGGQRFLVRDQVLVSSAGNSTVPFSAGRKTVFSALPAEQLNKCTVSASRRFAYYLRG